MIRKVWLALFLSLCFARSFAQYSIEVGSYEFLEVDPPAGYARSAAWSCDEGLKLTEKSEVGAVVTVTHYFSGAADVECSYVYEYLGSYDGNYHAGRGTETYRITCIPGITTLSETSLEMDMGDEHRLTCRRSSSYGTPVWTSSNEDVAVVDDQGRVKAIGAGTATITVDPIISEPCFCEVRVRQVDAEGIEISPETLTLQEGQTGRFTYKTIPSGSDPDVSWESSDESVATVSAAGTVTARGEGTARITVTTENGLSDYGTVEVLPLPRQVSFPSASQQVAVGYLYELKPVLTPSNAVTTYTWETADPGIAVVDSTGRVRGKSAGTTTVTVTTGNGKTASCRVTVKTPSEGMDYRNVGERIKVMKRLVRKSLESI